MIICSFIAFCSSRRFDASNKCEDNNVGSWISLALVESKKFHFNHLQFINGKLIRLSMFVCSPSSCCLALHCQLVVFLLTQKICHYQVALMTTLRLMSGYIWFILFLATHVFRAVSRFLSRIHCLHNNSTIK